MSEYDHPCRIVDRDDHRGTNDLLSELMLDAYTNNTWLQACGLKLYYRSHENRNVVEVFPAESGCGDRLEIINCNAFATVSELRETLESIRSEHAENEG